MVSWSDHYLTRRPFQRVLEEVNVWFFNVLDYDYETALSPLDSWRDNIDVVRKLRSIKNNLSILKRLDNSLLERFFKKEIFEWLKIKDRLP